MPMDCAQSGKAVRAGPHVREDQCPEVHDGQAVAVHRALGLLGDVVVHHPQEAGGEEEAHRVVAVPPLHHGILHPGVSRVALGQADRDGRAVDDVQQRHGKNECAEEPVGHIDVPHLAGAHRTEEHHREGHPHHGDQQVDRPLQFGVLLARGQAQRKRHGGQQDHELPAPESEHRQARREQPRLARALHHVVRGSEEHAPAERKDDGVGVQRP
jgi:23S rRNA (cytosine1962-C5)-methyltransferase